MSLRDDPPASLPAVFGAHVKLENLAALGAHQQLGSFHEQRLDARRLAVVAAQRLTLKVGDRLHNLGHVDGEHLLHVLTCKSPSATELCNNLLSDLMVWLESVNTAPSIENFINLGLAAWFDNPDTVLGAYDALYTHDASIDDVLRDQLHLGWYYSLCGIQTCAFVNIQQEYYSKINFQKLGTRWATNVTKKMWKSLHQIWKHRCNILHNTDVVHNNLGKAQLTTAITI